MLSDGESTFGIAGFMEKCFRSMLTARTYIDQGLNRERVLRLTGDKYPQKKAYEAVSSLLKGRDNQKHEEFREYRLFKNSRAAARYADAGKRIDRMYAEAPLKAALIFI